jgi:hypothetical protein
MSDHPGLVAAKVATAPKALKSHCCPALHIVLQRSCQASSGPTRSATTLL